MFSLFCIQQCSNPRKTLHNNSALKKQIVYAVEFKHHVSIIITSTFKIQYSLFIINHIELRFEFSSTKLHFEFRFSFYGKPALGGAAAPKRSEVKRNTRPRVECSVTSGKRPKLLEHKKAPHCCEALLCFT